MILCVKIRDRVRGTDEGAAEGEVNFDYNITQLDKTKMIGNK